MRLIKWFCRPTVVVGLALVLVITGLVLGLGLLWWNAGRPAAHLAQGRVALEQGDTDRAWAEFSEAVRLEPHSVEARRERARLALRLDRWEEGVEDLDAALQHAPDDPDLYGLRAEAYVGLGWERDRADAFDLAIADADAALALDPGQALAPDAGQALAYCQRALAYTGNFNDDRALPDAEEAMRKLPSDARVFFTRGRVYQARGEYEHACADFSAAIRLDSNHARALALRGVCRFALYDDARALADCNRAVELSPGDAWVYSSRAQVYRKDSGCTRELADLDRALELDRRDLVSYVHRAVCQMKRRDVRRAFADCAAALAINPDSSLTLAVRSDCQMERGRKKKALADMEKALGLRPKSPGMRLLSAALYQQIDEPDKGLAECDRALTRATGGIACHAHLLRALCFLQKGDVQRAIADCNQALKLDAKSVSGHVLRSVARSRAGDVDGSRGDFDAALRRDAEEAYWSRAETLVALKLDGEAITDFTELIQRAPKEANPYHARAVARLAPLLKPALMGVQAKRDSLVITDVLPDLPAGKVGAQAGDRILRVGSLQPAQFDQVIAYVATLRPGAMLELEVERHGKPIVFRLALAPRPLNLGNKNLPQEQLQAQWGLGDCNRAVELNPENPEVHRVLAEAYDLLDRHDEAIKSATEALRLDPEDPLTHLLRARSHLARNEDDKAIADANEALRLEAEGPGPYLLRGLAYAGKKQHEKASADLAEAVRLDPKLAKVKEECERLLAQEKPGQKAPPDPALGEVKNRPAIRPEQNVVKAALEPFRWFTDGAVMTFLGIGATVFVIAVLIGCLWRGLTRRRSRTSPSALDSKGMGKRGEPISEVPFKPEDIEGIGMIVLDCPSCGSKVQICDELAGTKVRCPHCWAAVAAPAATSEAISAEAPPPAALASSTVTLEQEDADRAWAEFFEAVRLEKPRPSGRSAALDDLDDRDGADDGAGRDRGGAMDRLDDIRLPRAIDPELIHSFRQQIHALGALWIILGAANVALAGLALGARGGLKDWFGTDDRVFWIVAGLVGLFNCAIGVLTCLKRLWAVYVSLALGYLTLLQLVLTVLTGRTNFGTILALGLIILVIRQGHRVIGWAKKMRTAGVPLTAKAQS
jgi:tetratricopeptide (TPR) repeat protein